PEQTNTLRIQYTGAPLPTDRESVFWLDIKAIAPKPKESSNELQVNVKSKFKIFYRPDNLKGDAADELTRVDLGGRRISKKITMVPVRIT
ncbi:fimbrial biogenesis chaperone, partial [Escherichia coli]|uniref:fimbrial biogenesis chaperone n=1 Tax=Escherichia coli TaxID=562 RepID=UPI002022EA5A